MVKSRFSLAIAYIVAIYSLFALRDRRNYPSAISLVLIFFALFYTAVAGGQLFYFQLDGDRLVVRNHIFRWYQRQYSPEEIGNVSFERRPKSSNVLRILTKDFKSRTFGAGTLWEKHWRELREALEARNIPFIRDTTI